MKTKKRRRKKKTKKKKTKKKRKKKKKKKKSKGNVMKILKHELTKFIIIHFNSCKRS